MTAHAAAIAEKLQGAHERRQRGEDKDMDENRERVARERESLAGLWDDDLFVQVMKLNERMGEVLANIAASGHAPAENASRVAELQQRVANMVERAEAAEAQLAEADARKAELEAQVEELEEAERQRAERGEVAELEHLLATAYVPREVPWSDVAAGMMTISAQGEAWMVQFFGFTETGADVFVLRNGDQTFEKVPAAGETVRVLVPYVTPEQAEATLRAAGAREVS